MADELPSLITPDRLARAYFNLFGDGAARNSDQKLVMTDLEYQGFLKRPVHQQRSADDGELTLHRGVWNDGRRSIVLHIGGQIERASKDPAPAKVSRKKKSQPQA